MHGPHDTEAEAREARRAARERARQARAAGAGAGESGTAAERTRRPRRVARDEPAGARGTTAERRPRAHPGPEVYARRRAAAAGCVLAVAAVATLLATSAGGSRDNPVAGALRGVFIAETRAQTPVPVPAAARIDAARRYAATRRGSISFAVVDSTGRRHGQRQARAYWSASVVKAMIMVAYLNRAGDRPLTAWEQAQLGPMIRRSDNDPATRLFRIVGPAGLTRVAQRAGMTRFTASPAWGSTLITAEDQARFFLKIDEQVPARHRRYLRGLLAGIIIEQRWGIPAGAAPRYRVLFKGGWRRGMRGGQIVHQVARLEEGATRFSIAILTDDNPSERYGRETLRGIAARLTR